MNRSLELWRELQAVRKVEEELASAWSLEARSLHGLALVHLEKAVAMMNGQGPNAFSQRSTTRRRSDANRDDVVLLKNTKERERERMMPTVARRRPSSVAGSDIGSEDSKELFKTASSPAAKGAVTPHWSGSTPSRPKRAPSPQMGATRHHAADLAVSTTPGAFHLPEWHEAVQKIIDIEESLERCGAVQPEDDPYTRKYY